MPTSWGSQVRSPWWARANARANGQPEPGAAVVAVAGGVQTHQAVEYTLAIGLWNAMTGIGHDELGAVVAPLDVHRDLTSPRGVTACVVEQVGQDLTNSMGVDGDHQMIESGSGDRDLGCEHVGPFDLSGGDPHHVGVGDPQREAGVDAARTRRPRCSGRRPASPNPAARRCRRFRPDIPRWGSTDSALAGGTVGSLTGASGGSRRTSSVEEPLPSSRRHPR